MHDIIWEENAHYVELTYGGYVDWKERFYICPECGEPVYECDNWGWISPVEVCPICGFSLEDEEEE